MNKEDRLYTLNGILLSHKKEGNSAICDNMDKLRKHYANFSNQAKKDKYCMIPLMCGI